MNILVKILNVYKYLAIFTWIFTHIHTQTEIYIHIFWLGLSSNFREIQPYLSLLSINNTNKQKHTQMFKHLAQHNFLYSWTIWYRQLCHYSYKTLHLFPIIYPKHTKALYSLCFLYLTPGKSTFQTFISQLCPTYNHPPATRHSFPFHCCKHSLFPLFLIGPLCLECHSIPTYKCPSRSRDKLIVIPQDLSHYLCRLGRSPQIQHLLKILPSLCIAYNHSSNFLALQVERDSEVLPIILPLLLVLTDLRNGHEKWGRNQIECSFHHCHIWTSEDGTACSTSKPEVFLWIK